MLNEQASHEFGFMSSRDQRVLFRLTSVRAIRGNRKHRSADTLTMGSRPEQAKPEVWLCPGFSLGPNRILGQVSMRGRGYFLSKTPRLAWWICGLWGIGGPSNLAARLGKHHLDSWLMVRNRLWFSHWAGCLWSRPIIELLYIQESASGWNFPKLVLPMLWLPRSRPDHSRGPYDLLVSVQVMAFSFLLPPPPSSKVTAILTSNTIN